MVFPHQSQTWAIFSGRAGAPACAIALGCTAVYGFRVVLADLGTATPYDRSTQNMGNSVPCYPRRKGSHSERVFSAFAVPSGYSPGPQVAWPTSTASRPRSATGRRPACFWYDRSNGLSAIQAVATMVLQGWRRVVLALVVRPRQSGNGYRPACPCSGRRGVPRSPQCGPGMRTTYQQGGDFRIRTSTSGHQVAAHVQGHSVTVFP